jgi:ribosomal-protein-alanine N-acetyltransferase
VVVPLTIALRPIEFTDWERVHEWGSSEEACRYQPWGPNTAAETQTFVTEAVAAWSARPRERYVWAACGLDEVIGVGEIRIRDRRWRQGEIAYAVHVLHWNCGIATAIATELLRFGFDQLSLHRIVGTCDPRNLASAAVLQKVGMTREGRLRETMEIRDGWRDSEVFSILEGEHPRSAENP